jgi:hypothetical protein
MNQVVDWSVKGKVSEDFFAIGKTDDLDALTGDANSMLVRDWKDPDRLMISIGASKGKGILLFDAWVRNSVIGETSKVVGFPILGSQIITIYEARESEMDVSFFAEILVEKVTFDAFGYWISAETNDMSLEDLRGLGDRYQLFFGLQEVNPRSNRSPDGELYLLDGPLPDLAFIESSTP